jgi:hypothetical protein
VELRRLVEFLAHCPLLLGARQEERRAWAAQVLPVALGASRWPLALGNVVLRAFPARLAASGRGYSLRAVEQDVRRALPEGVWRERQPNARDDQGLLLALGQLHLAGRRSWAPKVGQAEQSVRPGWEEPVLPDLPHLRVAV